MLHIIRNELKIPIVVLVNMSGIAAKAATAVVVLSAVLYQLSLKTIIWDVIGVGRQMQPIDGFDYECRRIHHPLLEACEDMWLDDETRVVYAACGSSIGRTFWNPSFVFMQFLRNCIKC